LSELYLLLWQKSNYFNFDESDDAGNLLLYPLVALHLCPTPTALLLQPPQTPQHFCKTLAAKRKISILYHFKSVSYNINHNYKVNFSPVCAGETAIAYGRVSLTTS
jgi:hypothetical protein